MPAVAVAAAPVVTAVAAWIAKRAAIVGALWLLWPDISSFLGTVFLQVAAYILGFAGGVFNWLVERTVVGFAETLQALGMTGGIDTVWTAFRDISNIVIIGMFTFIAISIILGIKEYGEKRMIAKVLIIAVLINFSLLFTKIIIDVSNFTALQFYKAASLPASSTSADQSASGSVDGISGAFLRKIGITGFGDTFSQLSNSARVNGN